MTAFKTIARAALIAAGWTMTHFYASDSRVDSWQEDMLGREVLSPAPAS
jgi:hypothetical protein